MNLVKKEVSVEVIQEYQSGQRLDNYLISKLKNLPKSKTYSLIRTGQVRVNSKRAKPHYKLQLNDKVRIPPVRLSTQEQSIAPKGTLLRLEQRILYEDESLIILNKPSGMAVHGGSGIKLGLIESLRQLRPDAKFLELVHRLDRETSGCILVAKQRKMLVYLHRLLREGQLKKTYQALVCGQWKGPNKVVMPLAKNHLQSGERVVKVDPLGKEAKTLFKVLTPYKQATLLEASPITGRTHQIRVHTAYMGHPIVGDDKYGKRVDNKTFSDLGFNRLFLHASRITIPFEDRPSLTIECELDKQLLEALDQMQ